MTAESHPKTEVIDVSRVVEGSRTSEFLRDNPDVTDLFVRLDNWAIDPESDNKALRNELENSLTEVMSPLADTLAYDVGRALDSIDRSTAAEAILTGADSDVLGHAVKLGNTELLLEAHRRGERKMDGYTLYDAARLYGEAEDILQGKDWMHEGAVSARLQAEAAIDAEFELIATYRGLGGVKQALGGDVEQKLSRLSDLRRSHGPLIKRLELDAQIAAQLQGGATDEGNAWRDELHADSSLFEQEYAGQVLSAARIEGEVSASVSVEMNGLEGEYPLSEADITEVLEAFTPVLSRAHLGAVRLVEAVPDAERQGKEAFGEMKGGIGDAAILLSVEAYKRDVEMLMSDPNKVSRKDAEQAAARKQVRVLVHEIGHLVHSTLPLQELQKVHALVRAAEPFTKHTRELTVTGDERDREFFADAYMAAFLWAEKLDRQPELRTEMQQLSLRGMSKDGVQKLEKYLQRAERQRRASTIKTG